MFNNPIISGFYPDPTVCYIPEGDEFGNKAGYYVATSTFSYRPGVPIFYGPTLDTLTQIGNALTTDAHCNFDGGKMSNGIYAPGLRYHKGVFYMITTNTTNGGNFYVTATDPSGEWSKPHFLPDAKGVDPCLFFDGDDCWYIGQRVKDDSKYFGDCEIWIRRLNLDKHDFEGPEYIVWDGNAKNAVWPEGPHLYKRGDYYYVMIAEGGTAENHSVCIARSKDITGPYESFRNNPIFTHRHLGRSAKTQCMGHADLVCDSKGNWSMVLLGTRPINGYAPLGRETFAASVSWEDDWPVVNPGIGRIPDEEITRKQGPDTVDLHSDDIRILNYHTDRFGDFRGIRVTDLDYNFSTTISLTDTKSDKDFGLMYLYNDENYVRICIEKNADNLTVKMILTDDDTDYDKCTKVIPLADEITLSMRLQGTDLTCKCQTPDETFDTTIDVRHLTSEHHHLSFIGCTMGIFSNTSVDSVKCKICNIQ